MRSPCTSENARGREPAHEGLPHLGRVGPRLRGKQKPLRDRFDGQRDDDLVGDLGRLPVAVLADQRDVLAHQLEQRLHAVECRLWAADHDRQRGRLGPDLAARHRRIQVVAAEFVDAPGEVLGGDRRDRAHVHHDLARRQAFGDALRVEQHVLDMIAAYVDRFSQVTLRIHEMAPQDQEEALHARRVDICSSSACRRS